MGAIEESAGEKDGLEDLNTVHEQSCSCAVTRQAAASTKSFATKKQKQRTEGTNHGLNIWWQSAGTHLPQPSFVVRSKHTQDTATIYGYTRVQACKQHVHTTRKHKPHTQTCKWIAQHLRREKRGAAFDIMTLKSLHCNLKALAASNRKQGFCCLVRGS